MAAKFHSIFEGIFNDFSKKKLNVRGGRGPQIFFVHVLAITLIFFLHTQYIPVSIISSAVQHVPRTLDFRPNANARAPGFELFFDFLGTAVPNTL